MASVTVTSTGPKALGKQSGKLRMEYRIHNPIYLLARLTGVGYWYTRCRSQAMLVLFHREHRSEIELDLAAGFCRAMDATAIALIDAYIAEQQEGEVQQ